ncbi:unnamed protein product [Brachionus calyciflorus]|uniref:ATPase AAA-type core domain-containing protein n=1 Tax=Brachionus calyciflorus TaxID=104777 RepID=A0A814EFU6_9BILA|nr:unnamed protein product [Brachionus calyciflorus]
MSLGNTDMSLDNFDILDPDFIKTCNENNLELVLNDQTQSDASSKHHFIIITGKNGVGKSRFLELIREYIVTKENENYPKKIVRRLNYGDHHDEYDPEEHPLVSNDFIESLSFQFKDWEILIDNLNEILNYFNINGKTFESFKNFLILRYTSNNLDTRYNEFLRIFFKYYIKNNISEFNEISNNELKKRIYFDEFKKYFKRQILKKISYGSLEQMLMLNMRYDFEIKEINDMIKNDETKASGLNFNYKIEKANKGFVDKADINERMIFIKDNRQVKFKNLSPGERLILHFIVLKKDKDNILMNNIDSNIKQILLLDEPDAHCEASLAKSITDYIKNELNKNMKIQVIMTTHNIITLFLNGKSSIFFMESDEDNIQTEEGLRRVKIIRIKKESYRLEIVEKKLNVNGLILNEPMETN